mgnify:FL=1
MNKPKKYVNLMIIGVPKEIKNNENRVAIIPENAAMLSEQNHNILIESNAGTGAGYPDKDYVNSGCTIISNVEEIYKNAKLITKVKEPLKSEYKYLNKKSILFTFLHLAANKNLLMNLLKSEMTSIAYEAVTKNGKTFPLLKPMSEIAGKLAPQIAANFLQKQYGGPGLLIGGTSNIKPLNISIIGAGIVGYNAAIISNGMGANVTVFDIDNNKLLNIKNYDKKIKTQFSSKGNLAKYLPSSHIIINGVYIPGSQTPKVIDESIQKLIKKDTLIIDVAIDQGGGVENLNATSHDKPIVKLNNFYGYAVPNIPGIVPKTASQALNEATHKYIELIANNGFESCLINNIEILNAVNTYKGKLTSKPVSKSLNLNYYSLDKIII